MSPPDPKADLHRYLRRGREAMVWKLDGLSDYDLRRPLTPTGTNLLGLVKHLAGVEIGYFGDTFGRAFAGSPRWLDENTAPNADLWVTPDESRDDIVGLYQRAWAHADATIDSLELTAVGQVPWWPKERNQATLHQILVHMIAETDRHAGHADIVRELIDGSVGLGENNANMATGDRAAWQHHWNRVERAAREAAGS